MTSLIRDNRSAPITVIGSWKDNVVMDPSSLNNRAASYNPERLPHIETIRDGLTHLKKFNCKQFNSNIINDVIISELTISAIEIEERSRIKRMTEWSQYYRQWQICLMLATIAKHCHLEVADLFYTALIPFLSPAHCTTLSCHSKQTPTRLTHSLPPLLSSGMLTSKQAPIISHEKLIESSNLYSLKFNLNCSNFYHFKNVPKTSKCHNKFPYSTKSCCLPIRISTINYKGKRPKTVKLSSQFKHQLRKIQHWVKIEWSNLIPLIEFLSNIVSDSPSYILQYFARSLQERLNNSCTDISCLDDIIIGRILSYLDYKNICNCSLVSKRWHRLANCNDLWKLKVRYFGLAENISCFENLLDIKDIPDIITLATLWKYVYVQLIAINRIIIKLYNSNEHNVLFELEALSEQSNSREKFQANYSKYRKDSEKWVPGIKLLGKFTLKKIVDRIKNRILTPSEELEEIDILSLLRSVPKFDIMVHQNDEDVISQSRESSRVSLPPLSLNADILSAQSQEMQIINNNCENSGEVVEPEIDKEIMDESENASENRKFAQPKIFPVSAGWQAFDFRLDITGEIDVTINPTAFRCLLLSGCVPSDILTLTNSNNNNNNNNNNNSKNSDNNNNNNNSNNIIHSSIIDNMLTNPLYPIQSVRLFTEIPKTPLMCSISDARRVIVGCGDFSVHVLDSRNSRPLAVLIGHKGIVKCVAISDVIIASGSWDSSIIIWDAIHFKRKLRLTAHTESVTAITINEEYLASGSMNGEIILWARFGWKIQYELRYHTNYIVSLILQANNNNNNSGSSNSNNRTLLFSASYDMVVVVWDITNKCNILKTIKEDSPVTSLCIQNELCVTGTASGYVNLWNLKTNCLEVKFLCSCNELKLLMNSYLNKSFKTVSNLKHPVSCLTDGSFPRNSQFPLEHIYAFLNCAKANEIKCLAINGACLFSSNSIGIYQWNLATCSLIRVLIGHVLPVTSLNCDASKLVSTSEDGRLILWHTKSPSSKLAKCEISHTLYGKLKLLAL